jgi:ribonuclease D
VNTAILKNRRISQWFSEPISKTQLTYYVEGNEEIIELEQEQQNRSPNSRACNLM